MLIFKKNDSTKYINERSGLIPVLLSQGWTLEEPKRQEVAEISGEEEIKAKKSFSKKREEIISEE